MRWHNPEKDVLGGWEYGHTGLVDIYPQTLRLCHWTVRRDLMKLKGYR